MRTSARQAMLATASVCAGCAAKSAPEAMLATTAAKGSRAGESSSRVTRTDGSVHCAWRATFTAWNGWGAGGVVVARR